VTICSEPHILNISTSTHMKLLNTSYNTTDITFFTLLTVTKIFLYKIKYGRTEIRMGSNIGVLFQYTQNVMLSCVYFEDLFLKNVILPPIESRVSLLPQKFVGCYNSSNLRLRSFVALDLDEVS